MLYRVLVSHAKNCEPNNKIILFLIYLIFFTPAKGKSTDNVTIL